MKVKTSLRAGARCKRGTRPRSKRRWISRALTAVLKLTGETQGDILGSVTQKG